MYTAAACRHLAGKGYPITVATPGNNVDEIPRVVTELGEHYDQVVLAGYPPFVKIVVDAGVAADIGWERYSIRMIFAGEVFSETWRDRGRPGRSRKRSSAVRLRFRAFVVRGVLLRRERLPRKCRPGPGDR
jgi:hypothetical protein